MSDKKIVVNQFLVKCNELIPDLKEAKFLNIVCSLIPEARDAYWHFNVSRIELYNDSKRTSHIKSYTGDEIEYYTGICPVIIQIYKKEKHLENVYIDPENDEKYYNIQVINIQKEYKGSKYYTYRFEQK